MKDPQREAIGPAIRPARPDDLAAVEAVIRAAFDVYTVRIGKPPAPMLRSYAAEVAAGEVLVLEDGDDIVGVLVRRAMPGHLHLDVVAVRTDRQGEGFGRQLMALAEGEALGHGLREVRLLTNALMAENLTFYAGLGYVETHRAEEDGYRRVFMTKTIAPHG